MNGLSEGPKWRAGWELANRTSSGHRRFEMTDQLVRLDRGSREAVILGAKPGDLELECPYLGTQGGYLVDEAPIGRAADVAEEGLGHIVSLLCAAGNDRSTRACGIAADAEGRDWARLATHP
jgi:hypothetical protein